MWIIFKSVCSIILNSFQFIFFSIIFSIILTFSFGSTTTLYWLFICNLFSLTDFNSAFFISWTILKPSFLLGDKICSFFIWIVWAGPSFNIMPLFPSISNPPFSNGIKLSKCLLVSDKLKAKFSMTNSSFSIWGSICGMLLITNFVLFIGRVILFQSIFSKTIGWGVSYSLLIKIFSIFSISSIIFFGSSFFSSFFSFVITFLFMFSTRPFRFIWTISSFIFPLNINRSFFIILFGATFFSTITSTFFSTTWTSVAFSSPFNSIRFIISISLGTTSLFSLTNLSIYLISGFFFIPL